MRIVHSIVMLLFLSACLAAEENPKIPLITVTGTHEMNIAPDEIKITIRIENREELLQTAKSKTDAQAKKAIALTKASQIQSNDTVTGYVEIRPRRETRKSDGRKIIYFIAAQQITITLRDFSKYDSFIDALVKEGLSSISVEYDVFDMPSYRKKARASAILAAQEKAKLFAETIGQKIGKAYTIKELNQNDAYGFPSNFLSNSMSARPTESPDSHMDDSSLSVGNVVVKITVEVSFVLE
jgi:uncharacterized protein